MFEVEGPKWPKRQYHTLKKQETEFLKSASVQNAEDLSHESTN